MTSPALLCRRLTRTYDGVAVVDAFDLQVEAGEIHALVGLNGAGKTTTMQMFLGMTAPDHGQAQILGGAVSAVDWARVGHFIETPFAYGEMTVRSNLAAAALLHGIARKQVGGAVSVSIDRFELGDYANKRARVLSAGNRQRLGLAAATIHRPDVLILDEPTNGLDPAGVVLIRNLLRQAAMDGAAILVSSHHLDELARISHQITVLHRGRDIGQLDPNGIDVERSFFDMVYRSEQVR